MPPVAVAVAGAAISASIAAVPLGLLAGGAFVGLGLSSATLGAIAGGLFSFVANSALNSVLSGGNKNKGGIGSGGLADQGIKVIARVTDDTQKMVYGRARIAGTLVYIETYPTADDSDGVSQTGDNLFLHMVIAHTGHEIDAVEEVYLDDELVTLDGDGFVNEAPFTNEGKSYVRIIHHLGTDTQVADADLVSEATSWSTDHRLRGISYSYIRCQWNPDVFTNGIPTLNVVIRGKKVYDPRTELTAWSDNAALCVRDYLTSTDFSGRPYAFGAAEEEIDDDFTIAAANICDEEIEILDATTIPRYTLNGVVDTGNAPLDNLEDMLSAMIGTVTTPLGLFRIHAGAYDTPETDVVDESWLAGPIKSRNRTSRQELFNAVRGLFINPDKQWQSDNFPEVTSATFEAQDNDERIYTDIELPYTTHGEAAQRIARTVQLKGREQITVSMPCNYKALRFAVWDIIKVNNTTRGWEEKEFRIVKLNFGLRSAVVLELREENEASYSWEAGDADAVTGAPDTNLPNPFVVSVPTGVAYDSRAVLTGGGDTVYNLVLTWEPYPNTYVTNGGSFEVQFKLSADEEWRPSFSVDGQSTTSDIPSNSVNVSYDLRVRAVNILGARSNWVTIEGAISGAGGGVGATLDWGDWTTTATAFNDWGDWTTTPTGFNDWEYFT